MDALSATPPDSVKALLLDTRLRDEFGDGLEPTVTRLRASGWSWRQIAAKLTEWTGVPVTHQTVRVWFRELRREVA